MEGVLQFLGQRVGLNGLAVCQKGLLLLLLLLLLLVVVVVLEGFGVVVGKSGSWGSEGCAEWGLSAGVLLLLLSLLLVLRLLRLVAVLLSPCWVCGIWEGVAVGKEAVVRVVAHEVTLVLHTL